MSGNIDNPTVQGFGDEWSRFDQSVLSDRELREIGQRYFSLLPLESLTCSMKVMDVGCGSGRWATLVAPWVAELHCVDPAESALCVAQQNLFDCGNTVFHHNSVDELPALDNSMDLVYSLGVLHHVPDTASAIKRCVAKVRPGGRFLVYLYYRFDNRPLWFRLVWKATDVARRGISRLPFQFKKVVTDVIAVLVYWPLARLARFLERRGRNPELVPLSIYRDSSFYTMRTDALDRFGTRLEQRFTKGEIRQMMTAAGLVDIRFSDSEPFWCAVGTKA
jgi:ubiquinone/menaquinone biosynthesis C-methylase UbiE